MAEFLQRCSSLPMANLTAASRRREGGIGFCLFLFVVGAILTFVGRLLGLVVSARFRRRSRYGLL